MTALGLGPVEMLAAWETGAADPVERANALLLAGGLMSRDAIRQLPLGARERALLALRGATFGPVLEGMADCPACGATLDVALDTRELCQEPRRTDQAASVPLVADGISAWLRTPTAADLDRVHGLDPELASRRLFEACVLRAERDGSPIAPADLSDSVREAAAEALGDNDPLLDAGVAVTCPECGTSAVIGLDVGSFLWQEVADEARRLLEEVATLARAFGWSEEAILAMRPARRRAYLALVD